MVIGAQPRCAALAQERFRVLPKEGRVEKLRPYLKRYELFPPRRNPENAPIRMEELRALVRKWNLHHKRHFWRNHPVKDDVVGALNKHIKHMKLMHENVESKKAEKREADRKKYGQTNFEQGGNRNLSSRGRAMLFKSMEVDQLNQDEGVSYEQEKTNTAGGIREEPVETGIIYMSRWGQGKARANALRGGCAGTDLPNEEVMFKPEMPMSSDLVSTGFDEESKRPNENKIRAQKKCSSALLNMTMRDQMSKVFLEDFGLLPALLHLMHPDQDLEVLQNCLACVVNILSENYKVNKLIEGGIVPVIKALASHPDEQVQHLTALALLALCSHHGLEEWLVQDGAIPALNLLARSPNLHTSRLALSGLVNVAVTLTAAQADSMQRLVVRTVTAILSETNDPGILHFCAMTTNNLTVLENVRAYLDDHVAGIAMDILSKLGPNSDKTITLCAATIFNSLTVKSCRTRVAQRDIVTECQRLISISGKEARHSCITILAELSKYSDVTNQLLDGGIMSTFSCTLSATDPRSVAISAAGLSNLATDPENHGHVLQSESMLNMLIQALGLNHVEAQHHVLCLLCGLVSNRAIQSEVVSPKLITAVREMGNRNIHAPNIGLILFNISCNPETAGWLIDDPKAVPLVVELTKAHGALVQAACLGTLQNLSMNHLFHCHLLDGGVMEALDTAKDVDQGALGGQCASVLYNFSHNKTSIAHVIELGGVFLLTHLSYSHFNKTKQLCAAAFCNITLFKVVTDDSFLTSLMVMSNSTDFTLVLCCAKTLANLSTYPRGRVFLGGNKVVVQALIAMMRSGVKEAAQVQLLCATALCNVLSVFLQQEAVVNLVKEGVVQDLIAVTVLRVNEVSTKEILAKALFNLLARDDTRKLIADQDAVFAMVRLTKLQSPELNTICVRAIHNLSCEMPQYESKLLEMEAEKVLVEQAVYPNGGAEVKGMCGAALAMVSSASKSLVCTLAKQNIVGAVRAIVVIRGNGTLEQCATTLFNISREDSCRATLAAQDVIGVLVPLHGMGSAIVKNLCVATICNLSCCIEAQKDVATHPAFTMLGDTMRAAYLSIDSRMDAATAVVNMVTHLPYARQVAIETSVCSALCVLLKGLHSEGDKLFISKAFRDMTAYVLGHKQLMLEGGMGAFVRLAKVENAEIKQDVATALSRLSCSRELAFEIADGELVDALFWLTLEDLLNLNQSVFLRCSVICRNVILNDDALTKMSGDGERLTKVLERLAHTKNNEIQFNVAMVFLRVTAFKHSLPMVAQGNIVPIIVHLAENGEEDIKQICSTALNQVPQDMVKLDEKMVKVLVSLLGMVDGGAIGGSADMVSEPSVHDLKQWGLRISSIRENPVSTEASWINEVTPAYIQQAQLVPGSVRVGTPRQSVGDWDLVGGRKDNKADENILGQFLKI
ncbi:unnamed protein product, partial [Discosporangium mesarthrocarpum]